MPPVKQVPAHPKNYSPASMRGKITHITIHWVAGTLASADASFQNPSRGASATYGVGPTEIHQYLSENSVPWSDSNWDSNRTTISIENEGGPNMPFDVRVFNNLVNLCRDIAQRHGLLPLRVGSTLKQHKDYKATQCAGYFGDRLQQLADAVNGSASAPAPAPQPAQNNEQRILSLAQAVLRGEYGNGDQRKARLGADYPAVQAKVNQLLGASAPAQPTVNLDAIADAVIRGEYGNGPERRNRLGNLYSAVQAIVNRKLGF